MQEDIISFNFDQEIIRKKQTLYILSQFTIKNMIKILKEKLFLKRA